MENYIRNIFVLAIFVATTLVVLPSDVNASHQVDFACNPNSSSVEVGESVTWSVNVNGNTSDYHYEWSGTDGLSGASPSVSTSYSTSGTKNASVHITSNNSSSSVSIVRVCNVVVVPPTTPQPALTGSCYGTPSNPETGDTVIWHATYSGGIGSYDFDWSGDNGLSGHNSTVSKSYSSEGTKDATVVISSGSQSITRTCYVHVEDDYNNHDDLEVYCTPNGGTYDVDERITWTAHASGGDGGYEYDWSGTDGLDGRGRTTSMRYDDDGTKRAYVTVESDNGDRETASCRVYVDEDNNRDDLEIECRVSDTSIDEGDRVTIEVDIDGGDRPYEILWRGDIDDFDDNDDRQTVRIDDSGRYDIEVRVEDDDGNRAYDQCPIIRVDDDNTDVIVTTTTGITGQVAGVSLAQVPYTGLTDNPVLNAILYIIFGVSGLIILGVIAFILKKRSTVYSKDELVETLESEAHRHMAIVSADAMDTIVEHSGMNKRKALKLLKQAISNTQMVGEDWLVLSKQKVAKVI
ncbi:MAG: hypothetical protein MRY49_02955 [Candidatus Pacebacteria bacterium]|nr:hypothetical protein [Candidatus Paceibacterota bacterium]